MICIIHLHNSSHGYFFHATPATSSSMPFSSPLPHLFLIPAPPSLHKLMPISVPLPTSISVPTPLWSHVHPPHLRLRPCTPPNPCCPQPLLTSPPLAARSLTSSLFHSHSSSYLHSNPSHPPSNSNFTLILFLPPSPSLTPASAPIPSPTPS